MRRNSMKRTISALLCAALLNGAVSPSVFAAEHKFTDTKQKPSITCVPFTETGIETQRTSADQRLLEIYNAVKMQAPSLSEDGSRIELPSTGDDGYEISLYGSSNKAVIDLDGNVTQPLEDLQVYLYYKVTNLSTGENLHMDDPLIVEVNGLYEDTQCSLNRPAIMPGIREWKGNEGTFTFSGNLVLADESLQEAAEVTRDYIRGMTELSVTVKVGTPAAGDIYLAWDESLTVGKEGYALEIDDVLTVTAPEYTGIVYAGATLSQMLMDGNVLPKGLMRDYPQYDVRATMLDLARFYMPVEYLEEVTMYAAFFKINEFHAHINDNNGEQNHAFRIESKLYPAINTGIPADEVYSQEEYRQYQKNVARYGIEVVTEIDTPAHSRFVSAYNKDYMLTDTMINITGENAEEVVGFIKSLFDEFLDGEDPVFQSRKVHIGVDEYDYSYAEQIRQYANELSDYVSAKGYEPRMWCSMAKTEAAATQITNTAIQHHYLSGAAKIDDLLEGEYPVIVNNSKYLYIVPVTVNGCADFMDLELCYNDWEAGKMSKPGAADEILQPGHPLLRGSETTIWYDDKVGCSEFDYFTRYRDQVMLMAEKNWFGKKLETSSYEEFINRIELYGDVSPLANPGRYIASDGDLVAQYDFSSLSDGQVPDLSGNGYNAKVTDLTVADNALALNTAGYVTLPFQSVGYPYSVDFTLKVTQAQVNAVLFDGQDGTLLLNYDGTGKMGIERKGYRFIFDYVIPENVALNYRIVCRNEETLLYVEDALAGKAQLYKTAVETEGSTSFVLPTERIGEGVTGQLYSLRVARAQLQTVPSNAVNADKTALAACLEEQLDMQPYSAATAAAYDTAKQIAATVYQDPGATQDKVDWAASQMEKTKEQLSVIHTIPYDRSVCPHCGKTAGQIQWQPWPYGSGSYIKSSGHYYLDRDINVTSQTRVGNSSNDTLETAVDVVLDLNGYKYTSDNVRCLYVFPYSKLSLLDSVGAGMICGGSTSSGGALYIERNGAIEMYNGTVTATRQNTSGGGVLQNVGGIFIMHSGMIYGGSAAANGGNVYIRSAGTFTMKGGTIVGGVAATGASESSGGNIYAYGGSTVNIEDGLIIGGSATSVGGNIAIEGSTLNVYGGTIRDGFAISGGNIGSSGESAFYMSGGYVTGGTARNYGANFRMNKSAACFTMAGGVIDGDISVNANMKLSGDAVINLGNSNGLNLIGSKKLDISTLSAQAKIYVSRASDGVFTTGYDAAVHSGCFLGAIRSAVSADSTGELRVDNGTSGWCPHCGKKVQWTPWTAASGEYITEEGHFYLTASNTAIASQIRIGDQIASDNSVVIDLCGKTLQSTKRVFYVNSKLALLDSAGCGKAVGAYTSSGGTIYTGTNARLQIHSGSYIGKSGETNANGGVLATNGETIIHGGYVDGSGTTTSKYGAAIYGSRGILTIYGGYIVGGTAAEGGSIYYTGDNGKAFTMYGGVITDGSSTGMGGNVYVGNEAVFRLCGGVIHKGTGDTSESNSGHDGDNVYIHSGITMTMSGGYILGADKSAQGNAVLCWTNSAMILDGDAQILNADDSGNLYIASTAALTVKKGFRGTVYARFQGKHLTSPVYGGIMTGGGAVQDSAEGPFIGKLYMEGSYGDPRIFGTEDGKLTVAAAAAVREGGSLHWCEDADSAAQLWDAYESVRFIKLYAQENEISAPGTHTVDLNGRLLTVAGGQVFCIDSANGDYKTYGKAVAAGGQIENVFATTVDGETYYMLPESEGYSFHKLDMQLTGVSLRPSTAGIYYNGTWQLDAALKSKVKSYGIAVSLTDMPTAEFDADTLWTELSPDTLESGKNQTSVIIENILRQDAGDNDARGKQKIYAAAYIVLDDGTETGHRVVTRTAAAYSLCDVLMLLDENAYADNQAALEDFYSTWSDPLSTWGFANIGKN